MLKGEVFEKRTHGDRYTSWVYLLLKKEEQNQGLWQKIKIQTKQVSYS